MRAALETARVLALTNESEDRPPAPTTRDVLALATIEGACACGLGEKTGSLSPGKEADVVLLCTDSFDLTPLNDPIGAIVLAAHAGHVDSVFVGGKAVKRDGKLVDVDVERVRRLAAESRDHLFEQAGLLSTDAK